LFNSDNNEEAGFADAYKSQILHPDDEEDTTSKNLIVILLLVAIIIGLSILGYLYMSRTTQTQPQKKIDKIEGKVIEESKEEVEPPKSNMLNNIDELEENDEPIDAKGIDLPEEVENIKIDKKPEIKKVKQEVKQKGEDTYLEQLADLSKEIDGEAKKR